MITPAASAEVRATPNSMHTENRKLPKKDSRNSSQRSCGLRRASPGCRFTQPAIATAAMPKRSQASKGQRRRGRAEGRRRRRVRRRGDREAGQRQRRRRW